MDLIWMEDVQERDHFKIPEEVQDLLRRVKNIPRLTPEEEKSLGRRSLRGDQKAIQDLAEANIRLIIKPAGRFARRFPHMASDIYAAGLVGLMKAARCFNPDRGRFSTVAIHWIMQAIQRCLDDERDMMRKPSYLRDRYSKVSAEFYMLIGLLGRMPTRLEWAKQCQMSLEELEALIRDFEEPITLDQPWEEEGGDRPTSLADLLIDRGNTPEAEYELTELREILESALNYLSEREREVINSRYGLVDGVCETLEEIGNRLELTRERIRQIESMALRRLRYRLKRILPKSMAGGLEDERFEDQITEALALFRKQENPEGNILAPQALLIKKFYLTDRKAGLIVRELEERGYLILVRKTNRKGNLYKIINSV